MSEFRARTEKKGYEKYWTLPELSNHLGLSEDTIKRWAKKGKIPAAAIRSPSGWALWSPEQVAEIRRVVFRG